MVSSIKMEFFDGYELYLNKIRKNEPFSYLKLNHVYWDYRLKKRESVITYTNWGATYLAEEVKKMICEFPCDAENLYFGVGACGNERKIRIVTDIFNVIKKVIPSCIELHCALTFKRAVINDTIKFFYEAIKNYNVTIIGLSHLSNLNELKKYNHYCIQVDAITKRHAILNEIMSNCKKGDVYLFQCGELLSFWLIYNLYKKFKNCFFIDMGRSLDYGVETKDLDCYNKNCDVLYNTKLLDSLDRNLWMNKCNWPVTVSVPMKKIFT